MTEPRLTMELLCTACGWSRSCGPTSMLEQLQAVKMLRPGATPDPELLGELFVAAAAKSTCPDCGRQGLAAMPDAADSAEWPGTRLCAVCRQPIGQERLAALPKAERCAACQQTDECAAADPTDYCSRCGSVMQLRPSRGAGITRYTMYCPACRR